MSTSHGARRRLCAGLTVAIASATLAGSLAAHGGFFPTPTPLPPPPPATGGPSFVPQGPTTGGGPSKPSGGPTTGGGRTKPARSGPSTGAGSSGSATGVRGPSSRGRAGASSGSGGLGEAEQTDILSSTLIAWARSAEGWQRREVLARAQRLLAHHVIDVQASADREQEQVRAFASVALGLAGERTLLPWNEPLRAHSNYLLTFDSLNAVRDLF